MLPCKPNFEKMSKNCTDFNYIQICKNLRLIGYWSLFQSPNATVSNAAVLIVRTFVKFTFWRGSNPVMVQYIGDIVNISRSRRYDIQFLKKTRDPPPNFRVVQIQTRVRAMRATTDKNLQVHTDRLKGKIDGQKQDPQSWTQIINHFHTFSRPSFLKVTD